MRPDHVAALLCAIAIVLNVAIHLAARAALRAEDRRLREARLRIDDERHRSFFDLMHKLGAPTVAGRDNAARRTPSHVGFEPQALHNPPRCAGCNCIVDHNHGCPFGDADTIPGVTAPRDARERARLPWLDWDDTELESELRPWSPPS